jgi:hypothetical protein
VKAIQTLLMFKGDQTLNWKWCGHTDSILKESSKYTKSYSGSAMDVITNQVVALYLISAIFNQNFKFCDVVSLIYFDTTNMKLVKQITNTHMINFQENNKGTKIKITDEKHIINLYKYYQHWFRGLESLGLNYYRINNIQPLKNTQYRWLIYKNNKILID